MVGAAVDARIEHVTLYASGARVRRTATVERVSDAPMAQRIRIVGLPLSVIDDTVRVQIDRGAIATNVRTGIASPEGAAVAAEEIAEVRAARRAVAVAEAEVARLEAALDRGATAQLVEDDPSDDPPASWAAILKARRAVIAVRHDRELALREAAAAARRTLDEARRALDAAIDRDRRTGSARQPRLHEQRKYVEIELAEPPVQTIVLHLEYLVAAARWAPSYVARLDGDSPAEAKAVAFEIRASVAQDTGEDWRGVPLSLSTAEPARFATLPELAALRIGRRQHEPARSGFRAAPTGADALYADYDRELPRKVRDDGNLEPRKPMSPTTTLGVDAADRRRADTRAETANFAEEVWDEGGSSSKEAYRGRPAPSRALAPASAPVQQTLISNLAPQDRSAGPNAKKLEQAKGGARQRLSRSVEPAPLGRAAMHDGKPDAAGGGAAYDDDEPADGTGVGPGAPRLDYGNLRMAMPSSPQRGRLVAATPDREAGAFDGELAAARARVAVLPLPPGCRVEWAHAYDYAYATDGNVDVKSDGAWHSIAVTAQGATARVRHVAVPREQADVFRIAAIANPFAGPLLPGPIDVYDRGRFLITSELDYTPPAASVDIGLGVDATVKIARNAEFREEATGMLRGKLELHHQVTIDVENLSGRGIDLEVRERVPVSAEDDDDVDVAIGKIEPGWERWTPDPNAPKDERLRGGHRWRVSLLNAQKKTLRASYVVTIAGKHELVGGNRREP